MSFLFPLNYSQFSLVQKATQNDAAVLLVSYWSQKLWSLAPHSLFSSKLSWRSLGCNKSDSDHFSLASLLSSLTYILVAYYMIFLPTVTAVYYQTTIKRTSLVVQGLKIHLPMQGHRIWSLVGEEPGRLQSTGSLRVGHDWATSLWLFTFMRRKWQPTPVFFPGESQRLGPCLWDRTESDTTEAT